MGGGGGGGGGGGAWDVVDDVVGPTSERGVDVDGRLRRGRRWRRRRLRCGLVPIGWLSFEFFPFCGYSFFLFPSDLEIVSICLVFIEFLFQFWGVQKLVHGAWDVVDDVVGPTSERGVDVDGRLRRGRRWRRRRLRCGLVPIGWLSFEFFPFCGYSFFLFPSDLEIVSICLVFIEFLFQFWGVQKLVHGWSFLGQGILCNFHVSLKIWIWFKICLFTRVIFGSQRLY